MAPANTITIKMSNITSRLRLSRFRFKFQNENRIQSYGNICIENQYAFKQLFDPVLKKYELVSCYITIDVGKSFIVHCKNVCNTF